MNPRWLQWEVFSRRLLLFIHVSQINRWSIRSGRTAAVSLPHNAAVAGPLLPCSHPSDRPLVECCAWYSPTACRLQGCSGTVMRSGPCLNTRFAMGVFRAVLTAETPRTEEKSSHGPLSLKFKTHIFFRFIIFTFRIVVLRGDHITVDNNASLTLWPQTKVLREKDSVMTSQFKLKVVVASLLLSDRWIH